MPTVAPRRTTLLAVATVAAGLLVPTAPARAQQAGGRIAVINMAALRDKVQEWSDLKSKAQTETGAIQGGQKAHQDQLNQMQETLKNLKPGTDQFNQAVVDYDEKRARFQVEDQLRQAALLRKLNMMKKHLFDEITTVVADVAKKRGIDFVTVYNDIQFPPSVMDMNPEQLDQLIAQKTVLYVNDKIDLTADVAAAMDARYKAAGGANGLNMK